MADSNRTATALAPPRGGPAIRRPLCLGNEQSMAAVRVRPAARAPGVPAGWGTVMERNVALLCREARLETVLRLALEADGCTVLARDRLNSQPLPPASAVVVDLDSLGLDAPTAIAGLRAWGLPDATPLLLVSVYPAESSGPERTGPTDYL